MEDGIGRTLVGIAVGLCDGKDASVYYVRPNKRNDSESVIDGCILPWINLRPKKS